MTSQRWEVRSRECEGLIARRLNSCRIETATRYERVNIGRSFGEFHVALDCGWIANCPHVCVDLAVQGRPVRRAEVRSFGTLTYCEEWRDTMSKSDTDTRTDVACTTAGIYRSDCADQERVTLAIGDNFPRCPSCRKAVGWDLAEAT